MSSLKEKIEEFLKSLESDGGLPQYITGPKNKKNTKMPKVLYSGPVWDKEELSAAIETIVSSNWLASGENVRKFEIQFSKYIDSKFSVMVNSGSSANLAMICALKKHYGWNDGDEIIVSCVGFPTTINPIIQNNLKPVFVDISWEDLNWNLDEIKNKITDRTVAVISSPVLGNPYDLDKLSEICEKNSIKMIGDNCDTLGTKWKGKHFSSYFVASSCSFYPAHHISTGEGGMVSSDNPDIIKTARSFAWWGRDCYCVGSANLLSCGSCGNRFDKWLNAYDGVVDHKYIFVNQGYNLKPLDMQGSVGSVQLKKLPMIHEKRRYFKAEIEKILSRISGLRIPGELENSETSWFGVPIICESGNLKRKLVDHLESSGIQTRNYFAGNILMHPAYSHIDDYKKYPIASKVLDQVFFMGCSPNYTASTLEKISSVIQKFIENEK